MLAFSQDTRREFMQGVDQGLAAAAKDRGLQYRLLVADSDAARQAEQVRSLVAARAGGVVASAVNSASLVRACRKSSGRAATSAPLWRRLRPRCSMRRNTSPARFWGTRRAPISGTLGGKAKVVLLTQDSLEFLAPRFVALRDSLVTFRASASLPTSRPPGQQGRRLCDHADHPARQPDIDVVLGADNVVLGALAALRAAGKTRANQFLGGIDGEPEAVSEIKKGNSPTRSASAWPRRSSATPWASTPPTGSRARASRRRWISCPSPLTAANIAQYEADLANPGRVYADPARRASYLKMYGNICYDTPRPVCEFSLVVGAEVADIDDVVLAAIRRPWACR